MFGKRFRLIQIYTIASNQFVKGRRDSPSKAHRKEVDDLPSGLGVPIWDLIEVAIQDSSHSQDNS